MRTFNLSALAVRERAISLLRHVRASMPIFIWDELKTPPSRSKCSR